MFQKSALFLVALLVCGHVQARHYHTDIDSFRMTCSSWGTQKRPASQSFIWDKKAQKMIVVGDAISGDEGRLKSETNTSYKRTIHHKTENWDGGKLFTMTFREDYLTRHDRDFHGGESSMIRTFQFSIPDDPLKSASVEAREFKYVEGILTLGHGGFLFECKTNNE